MQRSRVGRLFPSGPFLGLRRRLGFAQDRHHNDFGLAMQMQRLG